MDKTIYRPYFYIIQHINSGKFYAGVKYAENANPDNLLKSNGYQTSSYRIQNIILEEGLESFIIRKIKIFETGEEALKYESRFLRRVNAAFNDNFLNRSNNSISTLNTDWEKHKQTCLEKFGVENPFQSEELKEKSKQTMLERHGFEYAMQSEEVREKSKQTMLERHGFEYAMQSEEVREKSKQTMLERHGFEYAMQSEEIKEKYKQNFLKNHGVEHPSQMSTFKEKCRQSCLEKFGVGNPSQSEEVKEKMKQTCLENLGVENPMQSEEVKEKRNQNNLEKYGVSHPNQSPEIKEKIILTRNNLINRPVVLEIRKYRDKFKLKLGQNWFCKPQENLDNMFLELKLTYGEI